MMLLLCTVSTVSTVHFLRWFRRELRAISRCTSSREMQTEAPGPWDGPDDGPQPVVGTVKLDDGTTAQLSLQPAAVAAGSDTLHEPTSPLEERLAASISPTVLSSESRFRTAALRFYYGALAVVRARRIAATDPVCTAADRFRMLVIEHPLDSEIEDWEDAVCTEKERLGAMLVKAKMAGAVQRMLDDETTVSPSTRRDMMKQVVPNLWIGSAADAEDTALLVRLPRKYLPSQLPVHRADVRWGHWC